MLLSNCAAFGKKKSKNQNSTIKMISLEWIKSLKNLLTGTNLYHNWI